MPLALARDAGDRAVLLERSSHVAAAVVAHTQPLNLLYFATGSSWRRAINDEWTLSQIDYWAGGRDLLISGSAIPCSRPNQARSLRRRQHRKPALSHVNAASFACLKDMGRRRERSIGALSQIYRGRGGKRCRYLRYSVCGRRSRGTVLHRRQRRPDHRRCGSKLPPS